MSTNRIASENRRLPSSRTWNTRPQMSRRPTPVSPARTLAVVTAADEPMDVIIALLVPLPRTAHERVAHDVQHERDQEQE